MILRDTSHVEFRIDIGYVYIDSEFLSRFCDF